MQNGHLPPLDLKYRLIGGACLRALDNYEQCLGESDGSGLRIGKVRISLSQTRLSRARLNRARLIGTKRDRRRSLRPQGDCMFRTLEVAARRMKLQTCLHDRNGRFGNCLRYARLGSWDDWSRVSRGRYACSWRADDGSSIAVLEGNQPGRPGHPSNASDGKHRDE